MKHFYINFKSALTIVVLLFCVAFTKTASACNANFTHTNACVGDTMWFYAVDQYAIYTWDFGDSTSQTNINHDTTAFHVYNQPGTYYVTLFVNIGAEWEYQTQIITIGADCFFAEFTYSCGGNSGYYFTDQSVGAISVVWNFGDPSSGIDNTSTLLAPYHNFSAPGTYVVTLTATDGNNTDVQSYSIYVSGNCIGAQIPNNMGGNCVGDSTHLNVYYYGNITSYSWNFGDPASGAANTSTDDLPAHLYTTAGCYPVTLIISNGLETDTLYMVQIVYDCRVWPGDANADGEVNADDIFPIGMYYGKQGIVRPGAGNFFAAQFCTDWPNFDSMMYLDRMVNAKMADCDGNAVVFSADVDAISANFGLHHNNHNNKSGMGEATAADPTMYIDVIPATANAGNTVTASVYLGTSAIPVTFMYGYSFIINYDPALVDPATVTVDLSNNWLGSVVNNELTVTHNDVVNGQLHVGVVRKDKVQPATGYGQIASVTFQLRQNVGGNLNLTLSSSAKVLTTTQYPNVTAGNTQIYKPVNLVGDVLEVLNPLGVNTAVANTAVSIFPNPAANFVTINSTVLNGGVVELFSVDGRKLAQQKLLSNNTTIDLSGYANGVYICRVLNGNSVVKTEKVVINR